MRTGLVEVEVLGHHLAACEKLRVGDQQALQFRVDAAVAESEHRQSR